MNSSASRLARTVPLRRAGPLGATAFPSSTPSAIPRSEPPPRAAPGPNPQHPNPLPPPTPPTAPRGGSDAAADLGGLRRRAPPDRGEANPSSAALRLPQP
ncbi:Os06g0251900, partial [Oryza sativa Japonica Group]